MRLFSLALSSLLFASCTAVPDAPPHLAALPAAPPRSANSPSPVSAATSTSQATASQTPALPARISTANISGITFEGVAFDSRRNPLIVVDQPLGPGSTIPDAAAAASLKGGIAAVNAGFFTPEGTPLGRVVATGNASGAWNSASSLGSGVWASGPSGSFITRREKLGKPPASRFPNLLQAGPMLVENGQTVPGLDPIKSTVRTFLLWDGGTRWWMGRASACTLAELGTTLGTAGPASWKPVHALNLDGGRSSDLWISQSLAGGPLVRRPPWNRPVRNFLVLLPR